MYSTVVLKIGFFAYVYLILSLIVKHGDNILANTALGKSYRIIIN